jgi:hypothetical protein
LNALGLLDRECVIQSMANGDSDTRDKCGISFPEYSSSIIIENIFDKSLKRSFVAVRYNGEYMRVCKETEVTKVNGAAKQKYLCELAAFDRFI